MCIVLKLKQTCVTRLHMRYNYHCSLECYWTSNTEQHMPVSVWERSIQEINSFNDDKVYNFFCTCTWKFIYLQSFFVCLVINKFFQFSFLATFVRFWEGYKVSYIFLLFLCSQLWVDQELWLLEFLHLNMFI